MMAETSIPVDLLNPGQVFACLGIMEAAEIIFGESTAIFDWQDAANAKFRIAASGEEDPILRIMQFLEDAEIVTLIPSGSDCEDNWKSSWDKGGNGAGILRISVGRGESFPLPEPETPQKLPVVLRGDGIEIPINYWCDSTKRDNIKFWAGSGGYPGSAILRDAINLVRGRTSQHATNPFALSRPQTNSFRFDWRRDYVPLQLGFSLNKHSGKSQITMLGFPLVEILAAIGVTNARPKRMERLKYQYGVLGGDDLVDPIFHRAALGADESPISSFPFRTFTMHLDWPGKEGDARCITHTTEKGDVQ